MCISIGIFSYKLYKWCKCYIKGTKLNVEIIQEDSLSVINENFAYNWCFLEWKDSLQDLFYVIFIKIKVNSIYLSLDILFLQFLYYNIFFLINVFLYCTVTIYNNNYFKIWENNLNIISSPISNNFYINTRNVTSDSLNEISTSDHAHFYTPLIPFKFRTFIMINLLNITGLYYLPTLYFIAICKQYIFSEFIFIIYIYNNFLMKLVWLKVIMLLLLFIIFFIFFFQKIKFFLLKNLFTVENEFVSFDDFIYIFILFFIFFSYYFLILNFLFYLLEKSTYLYIICLFFLFLICFPNSFIINIGINFLICIKGIAAYKYIFIEVIYDYLAIIIFFLRFCIQNIRIFLVIFIYFSIQELFFNDEKLNKFLKKNNIEQKTFINIFLAAYIILWNILKCFLRLYFEFFHSLIIFFIQIMAFFLIIFWFFILLFSFFISEKIENHFL